MNINELEQNSRWTKPDLGKEHDELVRTANELNLDLNKLLKASENGKLERLTLNIWHSLENTDSNDVNRGDMEALARISKSYDRDYKSILNAIQHNEQIESPIVLDRHDNHPYLISGNTRLMVARVLGMVPSVYFIFY